MVDCVLRVLKECIGMWLTAVRFSLELSYVDEIAFVDSELATIALLHLIVESRQGVNYKVSKLPGKPRHKEGQPKWNDSAKQFVDNQQHWHIRWK